jgi:VWFA-related protein
MIRRMHIGVALLVIVAAVSAQERPAQDDPQTTFVTGVRAVRVDLYATRDGAAVTDLRADEIELLEDGVPQTIVTFERIDLRPAGAADPGPEPRTLAASRAMVADPRVRTLAVFLDIWHTAYAGALGPAEQVRFPVLRRLDAVLGPDDLVGFMTPRMRASDVTFGRGLGALARLEGRWTDASPLRSDPGTDYDDVELMYLTCYPPTPEDRSQWLANEMIARRREQRVLEALEELAAHLADLREERKAVLVITDGWRLYLPNPRMLEPRVDDQLPAPPIGGRGREGTTAITERGPIVVSEAARMRCEADRRMLASIDHRDRVDEIAARANRGNVSFYPIAPAGLTTTLSAAGAGARITTFANTTPFAVQGSLRVLADGTDGIAVVNTNNLDGGLQRIIDDTSAYYLLGYTPTNSEPDGRYRRITVRVNRPGVSIRARPGYTAPTAAEARRVIPLPDRGPLDPVPAALAALGNINLRTPLLLRGSVWVRPDGTPMMWMSGEIETQARREQGWPGGGGSAELVVRSPDGREVASGTVDLAALAPAFSSRPAVTAALSPGDYTVRVRLTSPDGSVSLSDTIAIGVPAAAVSLGDPLIARRGPATGTQYVPTADPRFRRNERMRLELPSSRDTVAAARLLDRAGEPLPVPAQVTPREDPADGLSWVIVDITLAPLAVGEYLVEVAAADEVRLIAFRIVP